MNKCLAKHILREFSLGLMVLETSVLGAVSPGLEQSMLTARTDGRGASSVHSRQEEEKVNSGKGQGRAGETAQLVKGLLCKLEDLSSTPTHVKSQAWRHTGHPSAGETETGESWPLPAVPPSVCGEPLSVRSPVSKTRRTAPEE